MANGLVTPSTEGAVQGSPLSPLLKGFGVKSIDKAILSHCCSARPALKNNPE
jgi:beta-lactamase superfamily II metal-dependent hydrolase